MRTRFGFWCECALHTGKTRLYQEGVLEPKSTTCHTHRNKHLRVALTDMEAAAQASDWEQVRKIGAQVWQDHSELLSKEPRLAFSFAKHYVQSVQYSNPDKYGVKWVALYERILEQYCANPLFTVRAYFWTMLETVRRWSTTIYNEDTKKKEQVFRGCQGDDLTLFLNRWMEIRRYLRHCFGDANDLMIMESHLYTGLYRYMHMMQSTVEQVEGALGAPSNPLGGACAPLNPLSEETSRASLPTETPTTPSSAFSDMGLKGAAMPPRGFKGAPAAGTCGVPPHHYTVSPLARALTIGKVNLKKVYLEDTNGDLTPSPQEMDKWIRESNPSHYPVDAKVAAQQQEEKRKLKWKQKKLRQRQRKKEQRTTQEDDSDDDLFVPIQYDFDEPTPIFV